MNSDEQKELDKKIIDMCMDWFTNSAKDRLNSTLDINRYVDRTADSIINAWRKCKGISWSKRLSPSEYDECDAMYRRVEPIFRDLAYKKGEKILQKKKLVQLQSMAADCIISKRMSEAGYRFFTYAQTYRMRVSVLLKTGSSLTFYLKYKDVENGSHDAIITGILDMVSKIENFETEFTLENIITDAWREK